MSPTQIHLVLNHVPVVGIPFAVATFAAGLLFRSGALLRFGLAVVVLVAFAAIPVLLTGEKAEERLEGVSGVSKSTIESHEEVARSSFYALEALGLLALAGMVRTWRRTPSRRFAVVMLVLTLGMSGVMAWTAHLGGIIRHTELQSTNAAAGAGHEAEEHE